MEAAGAAAACFGAMNAVARPAGGLASDAVARMFGMRGRLWLLWAVQTVGATLCMLVGRMGAAEASSLAATMAVMVACAVFVQAASGLTFGMLLCSPRCYHAALLFAMLCFLCFAPVLSLL
ncbi:unnamed protein product [Miscanthus lutarioriparius]|uniref:Uncharacterized protein n=1 Tax=Miscanthus lutarioriparius TaxID=422564 RepID=A0A811NJI5_9POAL|nr:unnamed protein product [Miscanthus lutarioriparius]